MRRRVSTSFKQDRAQIVFCCASAQYFLVNFLRDSSAAADGSAATAARAAVAGFASAAGAAADAAGWAASGAAVCAGRVNGLDESHVQGGERLFEQAFFLLVEVAFGFGLEHLQLVNEHFRRLEVLDDLAGFGMRHFAEEHHGHVGLLDDHVGKQGGHYFFAAGVGQRVLMGRCGIVHWCLSFLCRLISAIKK